MFLYYSRWRCAGRREHRLLSKVLAAERQPGRAILVRKILRHQHFPPQRRCAAERAIHRPSAQLHATGRPWIIWTVPGRAINSCQIKAFEDTWTRDLQAAQEYAEVLRSGHGCESNGRVAKALKGLHDFLVLVVPARCVYLSMMALRVIEMRRVLKPTGSIYLHCDPTASHYLSRS